jgi:hypothetical protein
MNEETKNLWNTKTSDLTVADALKLNVAIPIIMIGGVIAAGAVVIASEKVVSKFQTARTNRRLSKIKIVED